MIRQEIRTALEELAPTREAVVGWLAGSGWPHTALRDVSLVVTELVANAVIHGGAPAGLAAWLSAGTLRIEVTDAASRPPTITAEPGESGGYGLRIVESIAARWGWNPTPSGKVVWAEVPEP